MTDGQHKDGEEVHIDLQRLILYLVKQLAKRKLKEIRIVRTQTGFLILKTESEHVSLENSA